MSAEATLFADHDDESQGANTAPHRGHVIRSRTPGYADRYLVPVKVTTDELDTLDGLASDMGSRSAVLRAGVATCAAIKPVSAELDQIAAALNLTRDQAIAYAIQLAAEHVRDSEVTDRPKS